MTLSPFQPNGTHHGAHAPKNEPGLLVLLLQQLCYRATLMPESDYFPHGMKQTNCVELHDFHDVFFQKS